MCEPQSFSINIKTQHQFFPCIESLLNHYRIYLGQVWFHWANRTVALELLLVRFSKLTAMNQRRCCPDRKLDAGRVVKRVDICGTAQ